MRYVNDELLARLYDNLDPDHECTPYKGGCGMPHYRYNLSAPTWLENWPDYSPGREKAEQVRAIRDWGTAE